MKSQAQYVEKGWKSAKANFLHAWEKSWINGKVLQCVKCMLNWMQKIGMVHYLKNCRESSQQDKQRWLITHILKHKNCPLCFLEAQRAQFYDKDKCSELARIKQPRNLLLQTDCQQMKRGCLLQWKLVAPCPWSSSGYKVFQPLHTSKELSWKAAPSLTAQHSTGTKERKKPNSYRNSICSPTKHIHILFTSISERKSYSCTILLFRVDILIGKYFLQTF